MAVIISKKTNTKPILVRALDTVGDGSGTKNAIGDYSATPTRFIIKPPLHKTYIVSRMMGSIKDGGVFDSGSYGNGIILTNGITAGITISGITTDLFDGNKVFTNPDWAAICYDIDRSAFGSGDEYLSFRWTFSKSGTFIKLDGNKGDELWIELNDNFTGLKNHRFTIQGYIDK